MTGVLILALVPVALLIALGVALRRSGWIAEAFWPQAEKLGYYVLLPALFFHGLATARLEAVPVERLMGVLVIATTLVALVLWAARRCLPFDDPGFTSVFQGGVRFNNYVGVSAAAGLFGAHGIALAAVANAAIVPTVNILCVLVFARYGVGGRATWRGVLKQLALNPLLLACALGGAFRLVEAPLPPGLEPALKALGQASLPLGLLCIGAALNLSAVRQWLTPIVVSCGFKFLLMPVVTVVLCRLLGLEGDAAMAALVFQALPTASSAYIMARQLGGDAPLMAGIIAGQTLLAALALPAVMAVASHVI
ncbi:AEC family transporter [Pseudomonas entomophila]|uniref:AEC family transporter n=1 Tax=Pseudomonas entomophila TaxID=312306 RepID=UPI003EBA7C8C